MKIGAVTLLMVTLLVATEARSQPVFMPGVGPRNCACQTVSTNFRFTEELPSEAAPGDISAKLAQRTTSLYDIVGHQCAILGETFKGSCKNVQLNVNTNVATLPTRGTSINVNATATFEIVPQGASTSSTPVLPKAP
jgi:hypothetical protein